MEKDIAEKVDQSSSMILSVYYPGQDVPSFCRDISESLVDKIAESSCEVQHDEIQSKRIAMNISQVINTSDYHVLLGSIKSTIIIFINWWKICRKSSNKGSTNIELLSLHVYVFIKPKSY